MLIRIKKKANEEQALMSFTDSDVESLMKKLKYQAQIFAVDSSSFVGPLQVGALFHLLVLHKCILIGSERTSAASNCFQRSLLSYISAKANLS